MRKTNTPVVDVQEVMALFARDYLREQRRRHFWKRVLRVFILIALLWGSYQFFAVRNELGDTRRADHVGLIDVKGTILDDGDVDAESFAKSLEKAYDSKGLKALMLRIDSPGGSPVQANYMYDVLRHYRKKYPNVKVYAVCMDTCASAAYYVAAAADEIYADPSSIVGSIGVLYNGFGFVDTMQKFGVTRRLMTAGSNKGMLDPFSPVSPKQQQLMQTMLNLIHKQFIGKVQAGRGKRLVVDADTFSGLFWTGIQAKQRGLIDGFASPGSLARDIIKIDVVVDYSYRENVLDRMARQIGTAMIGTLPESLGLKANFR
jgi:protease-4